jgi:hypothetical protein
MTTIHFTGTLYRGTDGPDELRFLQPGHYRVSDAKADQLLRDFPGDFARVHEGTEAKKPAGDAGTIPQAASSPAMTAPPANDEKPAKKGR